MNKLVAKMENISQCLRTSLALVAASGSSHQKNLEVQKPAWKGSPWLLDG